ncbi:MAG: IclR family transcriptional regulator [Desulfobacteraceae bacterium]|nr:MAG: IclR family transcriptional regulator [Desulfobacteraceae bacterium]
MSDQKKNPSFNNRSLERALRILCAFNIEMQTLSLDQISKAVGLPKPTVFRLCSTLSAYNFLRYDSNTKHYSLGMRLFELGGVVLSSFSLRKVFSPYAEQLQAKVGKTTLLGILRDDELVYIDKKEDPRNDIRFASHIGRRRPPHFGMLGQVLMAHLPEGEVDRLLSKHPLTPFTRKSITRLKDFKKRLKEIRVQGYYVDEEGAIEGITGIAAPVIDFTGSVVAAVGVGFISTSVGKRELESIKNEVVKTARKISDELGHQ